MRGGLLVLSIAITAGGCDALFGLDSIHTGDDASVLDGKRADAAPPADASCAPQGQVQMTILGAGAGGMGQASMEDTHLIASHNSTNYGAAETLALCNGCNAGSGDPWNGSISVVLLRFDISAICPGSTIVSATLQVTTTNDELGSGEVGVFTVLEAWDEGDGPADGAIKAASWDDRKPNMSWTNKGAGSPTSHDPMVLATFSPQTAHRPYPLVIPPPVVKKWLDMPATNFGFEIAITSGNSDTQFVSREGSPDTERPVLRVTSIAP